MNSEDDNPPQKVCISLPEKPEEPAQSDCCGSGCKPCVFDIYEQELKIWEKECRRIKSNNTDSAKTLNPDSYIKFVIQSTDKDGDDCIKLRFQLPDGTSLGLQVGQHVIMRGWSGQKSVTRQYTPVSPLDADGYFDVIIKIYHSGKMSQIAKHWKVGDSVEFRGPFGNFVYKKNKFKKMMCLAAGTGIAPMIQVIRSVLDDEEDETKIHLFYSVQHYKNIIMKPLLDQWTGYWNFTSTYFLSKEKEEDKVAHRYGDKIHFGVVNKEIILSKLNCDKEQTLILICGTLAYDQFMLEVIKEAGVPGVPDPNIHKF